MPHPHGRQGAWARLDAALPFEIVCILPALIATIVVIVVPLLYSLGISFYRYVLTDPQNFRFIGLANYAQAFSDSSFLSALRTTFIFTFGTVAAQFVLGMAFALVVHNLSCGQGLVRTAMLVPIFMTPAVAAFMWRFILHPDLGIMNYVVSMLGFGKPVWLGDPKLALFSVMAVDIWRNTPFMFLIFLAGMQSLPSELYEAAAVDGATPVQRFVRITLPLLTPLILVALVIRGHGRHPRVRHHLHHDRRWSRQRDGDHRAGNPAVQLQGLQHGARIGSLVHHLRRGVHRQHLLRAPDAAHADRLSC